MKNNTLVILGASGHGAVVAEAAMSAGWDDVRFFDDAWPKVSRIGPWVVAGNSQRIYDISSSHKSMIIAIGNNRTRLEKMNMFEEMGFQFPPIIHPSCVVSKSARIGNGTVLCAGVIVNALSEIGRACIINTAATIDHQCILDDGVHVSPGANLAGGVRVGQECWIGLGAAIKQCTTIGDRSIVGMGSVVIRDVPPDVTVVGSPAKEICYQV